MIKEAIEKLMQAENLTYDQVKESVDEIMTGQAAPAFSTAAVRCAGVDLPSKIFLVISAFSSAVPPTRSALVQRVRPKSSGFTV